jgi:hypothetical protein
VHNKQVSYLVIKENKNIIIDQLLASYLLSPVGLEIGCFYNMCIQANSVESMTFLLKLIVTGMVGYVN